MSEYIQKSFIGGMTLQSYDTRLSSDQYVCGFNVRNRNDILEGVLESQVDIAAPGGVKQGILTFGNYIIMFSNGRAYYRYYLNSGWTQIDGFSMSITAPRYWFETIPVSTTNYARLSTLALNPAGTASSVIDPFEPIIRSNSAAATFFGNNPGLLVQDNVNQPQFIFLNSQGIPTCRTTQSYNEWSITIDATTMVVTDDRREYVPIGNTMAWVDGILYIASQNGEEIYQSVTGRPLDFVRAINNLGQKAGNASTTSYTVGVGGITCLRQLGGNALFVSASGANFIVTKNQTENSPRIFGEYTNNKQFLFTGTCLSDRVIFDTVGDTRFISLTGIRSFNAILELNNEGKNAVFSNTIQKALTKLPSSSQDLTQDSLYSAGILYDNYELYAVQTIFGPSIAVYDTVSGCWSSFDTQQTGGFRIKQFAKIESTIQRLYAIAEDDKVYTLYIGPNKSTGTVRTASLANEKMEVKLTNFRCVLDNITSNCTLSATPVVNNRMTKSPEDTKSIVYRPSTIPYEGNLNLPDVDTMLYNAFFTFPNCGQGWKTFVILEWTGGAVVQYSFEFTDQQPLNPLQSQ